MQVTPHVTAATSRITHRITHRAPWIAAIALSVAAGAAPLHAGAVARRDVLTEVAPHLAGFDALRLARVDSVIRHALGEGASPGAALVVSRRGRIVRLRGYGHLSWDPFSPEVSDSTLYDLASLTKAMGTATLAAQLVQEGRLHLDTPIHRYLGMWPAWGLYGQITARHLLAHTSGLPAGADLWRGARSRSERVAAIAGLKVRATPGTQRVYSDLGMILLCAIMEEIAGSRMDDLMHMRVLQPLAMNDTRFNPLAPNGVHGGFMLSRIAPTEHDSYVRKTLVHGVVHDLNAWALDGIAGHAGLFSSARDMAVYGQTLLDAALGRETPIFGATAFQDWVLHQRSFGRPLGWDIPTGENSSAGRYFSSASFGHTGFTGTSIWVDPDRELFVVLLTNRLNPTARNQRHVQLRRDVHDFVQLAMTDVRIAPRE
jgi:CubicO group peptidase (beta-lactamase class C family)